MVKRFKPIVASCATQVDRRTDSKGERREVHSGDGVELLVGAAPRRSRNLIAGGLAVGALTLAAAFATLARAQDATLPDNLVLQGTNYWPSIFGSPTSVLLFLVTCVVLFLAFFVSWRLQGGTGGQKSLGIVGIVLLLLGLLVVLGLRIGSAGAAGPEFGRVGVASVPLPGNIDPQGVVVAADGGVGQAALVDDRRLEIQRIQSAGKYEGKVDLLPESKAGEAKVTVNVADWWPYAFVAIAAGVALGYWLATYYKQGRTERKLAVRCAQLWRQITEDESDFQREHSGERYAGYEMVGLARDWIERAGQDLKDGRPEDAEKRLSGLQAYANNFARFRDDLRTLHEFRAELERKVREEPLDLSLQQMDVFASADRILEGRLFQFREENQDAELKAKQKDAESILAWVNALRDTHESIVEYLRHATAIDTAIHGWTVETREELEKQKNKLVEAGRTALMANKKEGVESQNETADLAYRIILGLELKAKGGKTATPEVREPFQRARQPYIRTGGVAVELMDYLIGTGEVRVLEPRADGEQVLALAVQPGTGLGDETRSPTLVAPAAPTSITIDELICAVWTSDDGTRTDCRGDADDLFDFAANVSFVGPLNAEYRVRWDFGDGLTSETRVFPAGTDGSVRLKTSHRFDAGGTHDVFLRDGIGQALHGKPLRVTVAQGPGRSERLLTAFRTADRRITLISGLLAVGSGLLALYFTDPAWGTPDDYLKAFLWGSVVSEGLKYVGSLASRVWPSG